MEIVQKPHQDQVPPAGISAHPHEVLARPIDAHKFIDKHMTVLVSTVDAVNDINVLGVESVKDIPYYINYFKLAKAFDPGRDYLVRGTLIAADSLPYSLGYNQIACLFYNSWYFEIFKSTKNLAYNIELMFANNTYCDMRIEDFTILIGAKRSQKMFETLLRMAKKQSGAQYNGQRSI